MKSYWQSLMTGIGFALLFGFVAILQRTFGAVRPSTEDFRVLVIESVLIGEAAGEGHAGIAAVAEVIRNRMERSGQSAYEVVVQPRQFSCLNGGTPERLIQRLAGATNKDACKYAKILVREPFSPALGDTVKGATHYHLDSVHPGWATTRSWTAKIGRHNFYRL